MNYHLHLTRSQVNHVAEVIERSREKGAFVALRGGTESTDYCSDLLSRRSDLASAVGEVAAALQALAARDPLSNQVRLLSDKERLACRIESFCSDKVPVVAFVNHSLLLAHGRVSVSEERDVRVWGPGGLLGLQSVLLRVGLNTVAEDCRKPHASLLGLVFRRPESKLESERGFSVLEVNCAGDVQGQVRRPRPVLADEFMRTQLGLTDPQPLASDTTRCRVEQVLGFPDCNSYLADHLPGLARYIYAVAHMRTV